MPPLSEYFMHNFTQYKKIKNINSFKQLESFEDLSAELEDRKIPFHRVVGETTLSISTRLDEQNGILLIRWEPFPKVIQFIHVLPLTIPKDRRKTLAILLNRINFTLPVTGFVMDEKRGALAFRVQGFLDFNGAIASDTAGSLFSLSIRTVKQFLPQLQKALASAHDSRPKSIFDLT